MNRRLAAPLLALLLLLVAAPRAGAQTVRVASYNIENFRYNFMAFHLLRDKSLEGAPPALRDLVERERREDDEENWEVASTLRDPSVDADILLLQESAGLEDLQFFNRQWLGEMYATIVVFKTNTGRDQHLAAMLKPGFKLIRVVETLEEPDSVPNDRDGRLFARGPAFMLVETPAGQRLWVGTTHQKSKGGNSVEATAWRNREAIRTRQIMERLCEEGPGDLILAGDMNDELGLQEFEAEGGGDTIANLVGDDGAFVLATRDLHDRGVFTFGGYSRSRFRTLIDHAVVSRGLADAVRDVRVVNSGLAPVASDHYPLVIELDLARAAASGRGGVTPRPAGR